MADKFSESFKKLSPTCPVCGSEPFISIRATYDPDLKQFGEFGGYAMTFTVGCSNNISHAGPYRGFFLFDTNVDYNEEFIDTFVEALVEAWSQWPNGKENED